VARTIVRIMLAFPGKQHAQRENVVDSCLLRERFRFESRRAYRGTAAGG
jgi:hypothetical protein